MLCLNGWHVGNIVDLLHVNGCGRGHALLSSLYASDAEGIELGHLTQGMNISGAFVMVRSSPSSAFATCKVLDQNLRLNSLSDPDPTASRGFGRPSDDPMGMVGFIMSFVWAGHAYARADQII